jgi:tRNA (cytidine/uridine-2'-O-)-methyltransferase
MSADPTSPAATPPPAGHAGAEPTGLGLVLFEPERPHNLGAAVRLCACLGVTLHVVEPCAFPFHDRRIREAALDYGDAFDLRRHASFAEFDRERRAGGRRLLLLTTAGGCPFQRAAFRAGDLLMVGAESRGVPPEVHAAADSRLRIPMAPGRRSLNLATAASIALGEALRQTGAFDALAAGPE